MRGEKRKEAIYAGSDQDYGSSDSRNMKLIKPEYFHNLLCELWIYLRPIWDDCEKTNQAHFDEFDWISVPFKLLYKAVQLVLVP